MARPRKASLNGATSASTVPPDIEAIAAFFGVTVEKLLADLAAMAEKAPWLEGAAQPFVEIVRQYLNRTALDAAILEITPKLVALSQSMRGPIGHSDVDMA